MPVTATDPFERLYRRYAGDVYRFALALVRNPTEAEDVTQTAFLNAFRAYARGERPERPHSWLIAITHNAIRSRRRLWLRRPREVGLEAAGELASPPVERSEAAAVLHALGELPANQREALAMRELEGRSYGEIASALGVSVSAVESLVSRARRTLRRQRAALRGLLLLPLRPGDEAGAGFAAKAAVVVAAAGLAAGGAAVERQVAGASNPEATQQLQPRPQAGPPSAAREAAIVPVPARSARAATTARTAPPTRRRRAEPPPAAAPPASPAAAPAPASPAASAQPAPAAPAAAAATEPATTLAAPLPPATLATAEATTPSLTTPTVTVTMPLTTVSVPEVTVAEVTVPEVTVPEATVPAVTVTLP
jgi:RNA polymerase sigma-70 factor, ECF subfamily